MVLTCSPLLTYDERVNTFLGAIMARLPLSEFSRQVGEPRETVRGLIARGESPLEHEKSGEGQRTYSGADLLKWALFIGLREIGMGARPAGTAVSLSDVVGQFFKAIARGEDVADWYLISYKVLRENDSRGRFTFNWNAFGESRDVAAILQGETAKYGTKTQSGDTCLGLKTMAVVAVMPCYRKCQETALSAGFAMKCDGLESVT